MTLFISKKAGIKFNIKVYYTVMKDIVIKVIIGLSILALLLAAACIVLELQYTRYYVEAGSKVSAEDIMGDGARFGGDFDPGCLNHAGVHYFTVIANGRERTVRLRVIDTKAPVVKVRDVKIALTGENPRPEDFIESIIEADNYYGEYISIPEDTRKIGEYSARVRFIDASGNKSGIFEVRFRRDTDNEAPVVEVSSPIEVELGGVVDYASHITLRDDFVGELRFEVDEGELDTSVKDTYTVYVTGIDAIGNRSERVPVKIIVVEKADDELETE